MVVAAADEAAPELLECFSGEPVLCGVTFVQLVLPLILVDHAQTKELLERFPHRPLNSLVENQIRQNLEETQEYDCDPDEHSLHAQDVQCLFAIQMSRVVQQRLFLFD